MLARRYVEQMANQGMPKSEKAVPSTGFSTNRINN
jgi:hypothetical protein